MEALASARKSNMMIGTLSDQEISSPVSVLAGGGGSCCEYSVCLCMFPRCQLLSGLTFGPGMDGWLCRCFFMQQMLAVSFFYECIVHASLQFPSGNLRNWLEGRCQWGCIS